MVRPGQARRRAVGQAVQVEVTWFDGELSVDKQREAIDNMATKQWDFVAIQAFGIDTLVDPVKQMIDAGIPVIQMDTPISKLDQINVHSFLEPDNNSWAPPSPRRCSKHRRQGHMIMTQGALGHTGAQGRARASRRVVKKYPKIKVLAAARPTGT